MSFTSAADAIHQPRMTFQPNHLSQSQHLSSNGAVAATDPWIASDRDSDGVGSSGTVLHLQIHE